MLVDTYVYINIILEKSYRTIFNSAVFWITVHVHLLFLSHLRTRQLTCSLLHAFKKFKVLSTFLGWNPIVTTWWNSWFHKQRQIWGGTPYISLKRLINTVVCLLWRWKKIRVMSIKVSSVTPVFMIIKYQYMIFVLLNCRKKGNCERKDGINFDICLIIRLHGF